MSETTPPAHAPELYTPQPTAQRPGLTPLGVLALILGGASILALGSLVGGNPLPSILTAEPTPQATHVARATPRPSATASATPTPTAITPSDAEIHATVEQETRRLVAEVQQAEADGDTAALTRLASSSQVVTSPGGVMIQERVILIGDVSSKADFWAVAQAPDSTGEPYTYAYNSRQNRYVVQDPTLGSFNS